MEQFDPPRVGMLKLVDDAPFTSTSIWLDDANTDLLCSTSHQGAAEHYVVRHPQNKPSWKTPLQVRCVCSIPVYIKIVALKGAYTSPVRLRNM